MHLLPHVASGLVDLTGCVSSLPTQTRELPHCLVRRPRPEASSLSEQGPQAAGIFCWWRLKVRNSQERLDLGVSTRTTIWPVVAALVCSPTLLALAPQDTCGSLIQPSPSWVCACLCEVLSLISSFLARAYRRGTLKSCQWGSACLLPLVPDWLHSPTGRAWCWASVSLSQRTGAVLTPKCRRAFLSLCPGPLSLLGEGCLELSRACQVKEVSLPHSAERSVSLKAVSSHPQSGSRSQVFTLRSGHLLSLREGMLLILASRAPDNFGN